ncbi:MAG: SDR family oxidoreductase [Pelobacteraceae bacterium]
MIVVTGATGELGRLVVASLLKKVPATEISVAVRNVEKAKELAGLGVQVRYADYTVPASWDEALRGADKVLLISSNEIGQRTNHHRIVINAVKRSGVKLLAYTSVLHAETSLLGLAGEHRETEALLHASGVPFVVLRNGWYAENHTAGILSALAHGNVYGCAGDGRISSASRADFAEAAAVVLTSDNQAGRIYELAGDTAFTLTELAAEISLQSGKNIGYVNLPQSEYKDLLLKAGMPEVIAELLSDADTGISKGTLFDESRQLSTLISRATTPLATAITAMM